MKNAIKSVRSQNKKALTASQARKLTKLYANPKDLESILSEIEQLSRLGFSNTSFAFSRSDAQKAIDISVSLDRLGYKTYFTRQLEDVLALGLEW